MTALRRFYLHLMGTLALDVGVIVWAAASGLVAAWIWTGLLVLCLCLASHASVCFAPPAGGGRGDAVTPRR